jgi:Ulp1 family protease
MALNYLKSTYDNIGGLVEPCLFLCNDNVSIDLNYKANNVYIVHVPGHWLTITNINEHQQGEWLVIDSLNNDNYLKDLKPFFRRIAKLEEKKGRFEVFTVKVTKQQGYKDCGLFAIAYAIELCKKKNPAILKFNQDNMRSHYNKCFSNNEFLSFPNSSIANYELHYKQHKLNLGSINK